MKIIKSVIACAVFILVLMPYHSGDINQDGKVTVTDLVQLRQMVEGLTQPSPFADLNHDGRVDGIDLNILRVRLSEGE